VAGGAYMVVSVRPGTTGRFSVPYDQTPPELTIGARDRHGGAQARPPMAND
jgi:hypothetical protein